MPFCPAQTDEPSAWQAPATSSCLRIPGLCKQRNAPPLIQPLAAREEDLLPQLNGKVRAWPSGTLKKPYGSQTGLSTLLAAKAGSGAAQSSVPAPHALLLLQTGAWHLSIHRALAARCSHTNIKEKASLQTSYTSRGHFRIWPALAESKLAMQTGTFRKATTSVHKTVC